LRVVVPLVEIFIALVPTMPEPLPVWRLMIEPVRVPEPVMVPVAPVSRLTAPVELAFTAPERTRAPVLEMETLPPV
jgi:hypothetical protein